jgi:hypothetical protein
LPASLKRLILELLRKNPSFSLMGDKPEIKLNISFSVYQFFQELMRFLLNITITANRSASPKTGSFVVL